MHPAFSVIFFTVTSGAGLGLFALLYLVDVFKLGGGVSPDQVLSIGILSLIMVAAGLMSSVFHLANPVNAWRAFSRYRTSWLSREGVFAMAFYPFAMLYIGFTAWDASYFGTSRKLAGAVGLLLAWITIFSTGMIYGCLKTIRQWNTPLVPLNYLLLGHMSGAMILLAMTAGSEGMNNALRGIVLMLLVVAAAMKGVYYYWIGYPRAMGSTINTATGFTRAKVKILDQGHTHGTFLTQEFGYQVSRQLTWLLKAVVFAAAFVLPILLLAGVLGGASAGGAVALVLFGLVVERWLFFAEARHVINLFHGAQRC